VIPDCNIPLSEEEFHYDGDYILDRTLQLIADGTYIEIPTTTVRAKWWGFHPSLLIAIAFICLLLILLLYYYTRKR
jgi:hypothetical protein